MSAAGLPNISADLVWEIVRDNNSYLAKSKRNGGIRFTRDPLNLTGIHSRKHAGFVNEKAVGVIPNEKGGVTIISKKASQVNKPAQATTRITFGGNKSARKTYKAAANQTAKSGYRADLRESAVQRISAIRRSQKPVREDPEPKLRGKKARQAAEKDA